MSWLKWREALKPSGRYNRSQFLFWFFIPIIFVVLIITNTWELEKLLIKLSYHVGLLGFNVGQLSTFLSILLVVFFIYVITIAMIKRCHDLNRSGWWVLSGLVPIFGMLFFVYLLKARPDEPGTKKWTQILLPSLAAIFGLFFGLFLVIIGLLLFLPAPVSSPYKAAPFRVWNQTDQLLSFQVIASDGVVYQGYPAREKIAPDEIIREEGILLVRGDYTVKAKNTRGDVVYSKDFTSEELAEMHWIVVIPPAPE